MKPTVSAVLIVKNESECLEKCLKSINGVDEIIICDTGSDDNTIEIAKKYTNKVFEDYKWNDNFAEARNHALSKATGDWILSIDADEYLKNFEDLFNDIKEAEKKGVLAIDCKLIAEGDGQMHRFPRLFKKSPKVWWEGAVHNHISVQAGHNGETTITYGYSPAHIKDPGRAMRILLKEVARTGNAREIYYLGREYWYRKNYKECLETMEKYIKKAHFLPEKADAFLLMARCYHATGEWETARSKCMEAITINPHFKEAVGFMIILAGKGTGNPLWENNGLWWEKASQFCDNTNVLFIR